MSDNLPTGNHVKLDRLSDHDLLVRIAAQVECIPGLEKRVEANEQKIARLDERQKATTGVLAVLMAVGSTIAGAVGSLVK